MRRISMESNSLEVKLIKELCSKTFYIPDYQRGYRWERDKVKYLLNDLLDFVEKKKNGEVYCLQPLIVKKIENTEAWEVIDGQQRLTTIFIILDHIYKKIYNQTDVSIYNIVYETGDASYLENITEENKDEHINNFYIYQAKQEIKKWFENQKYDKFSCANKIQDVLMNNTQVLWYELSPLEDEINVFTRINSGKIPLTNAELIRALLLKKDNFIGNEDNEKLYLKQLEIANEWDQIENQLQNDEFWYFLNNLDSKHYDTRIELIFDIIACEEGHILNNFNEYDSFNYFYEKFKEVLKKDLEKAINKLWENVKKHYMLFEEWYNNKELYHLIGYLIFSTQTKEILNESKLLELVSIAFKTDKTTLKKELINQVKKSIEYEKDYKELRYDSSSDLIRNILLFFNIVTIINNNKCDVYFPFDRYKRNESDKKKPLWDIEHIHSQNSEVPNNKKQIEEYFLDIISYMEKEESKDENKVEVLEELKKLRNEYTENGKFNDVQKFEQVYDQVFELYGDATVSEKPELGNLALLSAEINRAYGNAPFSIKRKFIIDKDKEGQFIPICTKNVFFKYYSKQNIQVDYWSKSDKNDYYNEIVETLKNYFDKVEE